MATKLWQIYYDNYHMATQIWQIWEQWKHGKSPAHLKEAAAHNQKRNQVGEYKVGQVVTGKKNGSSYHLSYDGVAH